jgi:hypothetical protein
MRIIQTILKGNKGTIVSGSREFYRGDKTLAER